jgi:hypothetical protein
MLLPGGDIVFDHYIVKITHQVSLNEISQQVSAPPPPAGVTFPNIEAGTYDILVTGFNALDELLGSGTGTVTVLANDTSAQTVQVEYETGTGAVEVDYTLVPEDLLFAPGIEAKLWDQISWLDVSVTQGGPSGPGWHYSNNAIPAGFYALRFELHSYGDTDKHVSGGMEAIFVMGGRTTQGAYEFNALNITPPTTGSANVIIWEPQDMPFNVVFLDGLSKVDTDSVFTLMAAADVPVDNWYWFKNGVELVGETNNMLVVTASSEERFDIYSVLAQAGGALSSAQKGIEQVTPPPLMSSATWTSPSIPVSIAGNTAIYPLAADIFDNGNPMSDGETIYWRIDPNTDPDALAVLDLSVSASTVSSGSVTNILNNSGNLAPSDYTVIIQISSQSDFSGFVSNSPVITYGNY